MIILSFLILGDLCTIHLIGSEAVDLDFIRFILRLNDFDGLANAELLKIAGAVVGGFLCWWNYVKEEYIAKTNTAKPPRRSRLWPWSKQSAWGKSRVSFRDSSQMPRSRRPYRKGASVRLRGI